MQPDDTMQARPRAYWCVVGHEIAGDDLERLTAVEALDGAARVRLCREHGTPVAMRIEAKVREGDARIEPPQGET